MTKTMKIQDLVDKLSPKEKEQFKGLIECLQKNEKEIAASAERTRNTKEKLNETLQSLCNSLDNMSKSAKKLVEAKDRVAIAAKQMVEAKDKLEVTKDKLDVINAQVKRAKENQLGKKQFIN